MQPQLNQYNLAKNSIKSESLDLAVGESRKIYCPFCEVTHEKSCNVTKEETGIVYHCFRAKCHASGFIPSLTTDKRPRVRKSKQYRHFTEPLSELSEDALAHLKRAYGFTEQDTQRGRIKLVTTGRGRLYLPILTEDGMESGAVTKLIKKVGGAPKTLTYYWSPLYNLHIADSAVVGGPLVVVEDILSATKVARHARCAALLGTSMTEDQAMRLKVLSTKLIVALDADTWHNGRSIGLSMKKKYGLLFENFSVVRLSKDPKDMTDEEIREVILNGNRTESSRSGVSG